MEDSNEVAVAAAAAAVIQQRRKSEGGGNRKDRQSRSDRRKSGPKSNDVLHTRMEGKEGRRRLSEGRRRLSKNRLSITRRERTSIDRAGYPPTFTKRTMTHAETPRPKPGEKKGFNAETPRPKSGEKKGFNAPDDPPTAMDAFDTSGVASRAKAEEENADEDAGIEDVSVGSIEPEVELELEVVKPEDSMWTKEMVEEAARGMLSGDQQSQLRSEQGTAIVCMLEL